jgi:hypothetical protein
VTTVELEQAVHQLEHQARVAVLLVKRELDQLAAANGDAMVSAGRHSPQDAPPTVAEGPNIRPKVCRVCGQQKPGSEFEPGRRQCRTCRRRYEREREAARRDRANGTAPAAEAPASPDPPEPQPA